MATRPNDPWPTDSNPDQPAASRRRGTRAVNGDCSRKRRFDPLRRAYYARYRQQRLARRLFGTEPPQLPRAS